MRQGLRERIKAATEQSGITKLDFLEILKSVNQHYDKMEATIAQSVRSRVLQDDTPIEAILDSVTEALLSVGADGVIRNCNKVCSRYFGVEKNELIGSNITRILPGAMNQSLEDYLSPYMSDLDDTHLELGGGEVQALRAGDEAFASEINATLLTTEEEPVFVISLRDVTERKQSECALRENEERYRALVENAPEAIIVFDVDSNQFSDANENACKLFNLSRSRLLSVGPEAISPKTQPDGSPSFGVRRGLVDRALAGEHPTFEWMHQDSAGKQIPCEVRFSCLPSDNKRLLRVSITNIAERKRDEALSFAQNKVLEMIAANTPHDKTMRAICRFAETIGDGFKAAIMRLDKQKHTLSIDQAPSLSDSFKLCLDFVKVGPKSLTCGSAVHFGQDRVTKDIQSDTGWLSPAKEAAKHDINAVWSFVVSGAASRVIGTLDIYLDSCRAPSTDEIDQLSRMARLAGIAIRRQQDEEKLRTSESRYRGLFESVIDGVYIATREGEIITANPALVEMLGFDSVDDLKAAGLTPVLYVNPIDRERVLARLAAEGVVKNFEYRLRRKDGSTIVVLENSRAMYDDAGNLTAHEGTITDITDRKHAETRVFEEKERAQITLQSIGDGVVTTDADGNVDYINPVAQDLTGWSMRTAKGAHIADIMMIVNAHTRATVENPVVRCLKEGRVISLAENSILMTRDGDEIPIQDSAAPIRDRIGNIIGSVMVFHDVSKETRLFRQLSYQASHDTLTGLVNRREFENHLIRALDTVREDNEESHGLLYVDLDQFKVVNDTFGHNAGDALLRQLTDLIQGSIRSTDILSRLGGDEFGILLERCDEKRAIEVAESIRGSIEGYRFEWQGSFTTIRCSIGIVLVTNESADAADIMSAADVACYSAKDMGRNQIHLYKDSDASMRHEEMKWVSKITSAVEDNRLELFFQPIIGIGKENGKGRGHYELLLRMRDENGNLVSPDQFIPSAERYNLMSTLDRWVVRQALTELADRSTTGEARYTLAINLSGTSLSEDRFLEFVIDELKKHDLPKGAICFEITETAAISNLSRVIHFMQALKKLGCKFSLDDFGSGLSSFTYLKNLPVDYLKIDGHFIRNVVEDVVDESMVRAIREVGHAMGIETIAERVETKQVLQKLGSLGVEFAQGYYIARPAPVTAFNPWNEDESEQRLA
ncbi:MAG: EAL domain-containing protein [Gammaproteobacteria bacterium]|nr:EAL domain-containing protein [Gammaproteobacteria bacterium]MBU2675444.1 EAL domain-containing protein [Gammaproteobacteria bacterium]NNC56807.1 EAL domain-containing protein [Woeseiaceae bacterium]NNL49178.1 EAL domain-containing protein [Woeseiaceae bacterium]